MHATFLSGNQNDRDDLDYLSTGGIIILKWILKTGFSMWVGFVWLTIEYSGSLL
jgi:hypothetical protein